MPATHEDALVVLQQQTPGVLYRFGKALALNPELGIAAAAEAAGAPGQGGQLIRDPRVSQVMHAVWGLNQETFKDQRRAALQLLIRLVGFDPAEAFTKEGFAISNIWEIPPDIRVAIKKTTVKPDGSLVIEWHDRVAALRLLMEHFGDIDTRNVAVGGRAQVIFRGRSAG